jgi:hypothetical protein
MSITRVSSPKFSVTRVPDSGNTIFQKIANFPFEQGIMTEKYIILKIVGIKKYKSRLRNTFRSVFLEKTKKIICFFF